MINNYIKNCSLTLRLVILIVFLTPALPLLEGCSSFSTLSQTTKRITRNIKAPDRNLKKKIGVAFFENKTSLVEQKVEENFLNYLVENLKKPCSELIMVKPGDAGYPDFLIDLPRQPSGLIDNFNLSKAGKRFGLNVIITGALTNIRKNQQERGFWWFKKTDHYVQVEMSVAVYDTTTGAKLLDESFAHKIETEDIEGDLSSTANLISAPDLTSAFEHIAAGLGEQLCDAVIMQPWQGAILSIDGDKIIIPAGINVGIKAGDVFYVYRNDDTIQGFEGQRFFVPGIKIGEIKIITVSPEQSEAVLLTGKNIVPGCSISPKH
jgi:hypothetical protein